MNSRTTHLAAALAGGLLSVAAAAQVKTDGEWRGAGGAAFSATSGNTSSTSALLNLDLVRATERDKITLGAMANYARSKNAVGVTESTADKWGGFGQYDYNLTPRTYVFGKLGLEADRLVDLRLRTSLAGGAGYKLIDTPENAFSVFTGLGYTTDTYSVSQTIDGNTGSRFSRASVLLGEESSHQLSSTVALKQRLEVSPGYTGDRAVLAKFTAGLGVAMSSSLSLNVGLSDTYNSKPPAGFKRNDIGVFTGINVKFGAE